MTAFQAQACQPILTAELHSVGLNTTRRKVSCERFTSSRACLETSTPDRSSQDVALHCVFQAGLACASRLLCPANGLIPSYTKALLCKAIFTRFQQVALFAVVQARARLGRMHTSAHGAAVQRHSGWTSGSQPATGQWSGAGTRHPVEPPRGNASPAAHAAPGEAPIDDCILSKASTGIDTGLFNQGHMVTVHCTTPCITGATGSLCCS